MRGIVLVFVVVSVVYQVSAGTGAWRKIGDKERVEVDIQKVEQFIHEKQVTLSRIVNSSFSNANTSVSSFTVLAANDERIVMVNENNRVTAEYIFTAQTSVSDKTESAVMNVYYYVERTKTKNTDGITSIRGPLHHPESVSILNFEQFLKKFESSKAFKDNLMANPAFGWREIEDRDADIKKVEQFIHEKHVTLSRIVNLSLGNPNTSVSSFTVLAANDERIVMVNENNRVTAEYIFTAQTSVSDKTEFEVMNLYYYVERTKTKNTDGITSIRGPLHHPESVSILNFEQVLKKFESSKAFKDNLMAFGWREIEHKNEDIQKVEQFIDEIVATLLQIVRRRLTHDKSSSVSDGFTILAANDELINMFNGVDEVTAEYIFTAKTSVSGGSKSEVMHVYYYVERTKSSETEDAITSIRGPLLEPKPRSFAEVVTQFMSNTTYTVNMMYTLEWNWRQIGVNDAYTKEVKNFFHFLTKRNPSAFVIKSSQSEKLSDVSGLTFTVLAANDDSLIDLVGKKGRSAEYIFTAQVSPEKRPTIMLYDVYYCVERKKTSGTDQITSIRGPLLQSKSDTKLSIDQVIDQFASNPDLANNVLGISK